MNAASRLTHDLSRQHPLTTISYTPAQRKQQCPSRTKCTTYLSYIYPSCPRPLRPVGLVSILTFALNACCPVNHSTAFQPARTPSCFVSPSDPIPHAVFIAPLSILPTSPRFVVRPVLRICCLRTLATPPAFSRMAHPGCVSCLSVFRPARVFVLSAHLLPPPRQKTLVVL